MTEPADFAAESPLLTSYELAPPGRVAKEADAVAALVRRAFGVADPARHVVTVSRYSGWIQYQDRARLWQGRSVSLPPREAIEKTAEQRLGTLLRALSDRQQLPETLRGLVPPQLRPAGTIAMVGMRGGYDHWLCRFEPMLGVAVGQPMAPVVGSVAELRVGADGALVAFSLRWRALTGRTARRPQHPPAERLLSPDDAVHGGSGAAPHDDEQPLPLVFVLEGEGTPQLFLSPFYQRLTGHALAYASACPLSLTVDLWGDMVTTGMRLRAFAAGGSGRYDYEWAVAPLNDPFAFESYGNGSTHDDGDQGAATSAITVPVGAYLVAVQVRDRVTGGFQHFQQQVFCSALTEDGEPALGDVEYMP